MRTALSLSKQVISAVEAELLLVEVRREGALGRCRELLVLVRRAGDDVLAEDADAARVVITVGGHDDELEDRRIGPEEGRDDRDAVLVGGHPPVVVVAHPVQDGDFQAEADQGDEGFTVLVAQHDVAHAAVVNVFVVVDTQVGVAHDLARVVHDPLHEAELLLELEAQEASQ